MNYTDIIRLTSGLLQFGVACYALRLGRLFNAAKVGWLMFSGLSLLALAYVLLPINPFRSSFQLALKADLIYALISVLLLAGMVHLDLRFKQRQQTERAEHKAQTEWEFEVEKKFVEANRINDALQQTVARLQAEILQQKQNQEQTEKTNQELFLAARQTESDLKQSLEKLQTVMLEQKQAHLQAQELAEKAYAEQLITARQTGVTETAAGILHEVDGLLNEIQTVGRVAGSLIASGPSPAARVSRLVRQQQMRDTRRSVKPDLRSRRGTGMFTTLTQQLSSEHSLLFNKINALKRKIALIQSAVQRSHDTLATIAGVESSATGTESAVAEPVASAVESPAPAELETVDALQEHLIDNVTQTGTESPDTAPSPADEESDTTIPDSIQIGIMPPHLFGR